MTVILPSKYWLLARTFAVALSTMIRSWNKSIKAKTRIEREEKKRGAGDCLFKDTAIAKVHTVAAIVDLILLAHGYQSGMLSRQILCKFNIVSSESVFPILIKYTKEIQESC